MYGMVYQHKHRGLWERGVIRTYDHLIVTSKRPESDDGKEAHERLQVGGQEHITVSCRVLTRFTFISATSFGVGDTID